MIKDKIKTIFLKKKEEGRKLNIQNLIVFLIILIITIIAIDTIWNGDTKEKDMDKISKNSDVQVEKQEENFEYNLEQRLENILGKIQGVGEVKVLITYSETSKLVTMFNESTKETATEENDKEGGTRKITEVDTSKEIVYEEENGEKRPITEKVIMPKIEGAIVIARRTEQTPM